MARMNVPNLGGTLVLVLAAVAMLPVYNTAINQALPQLGSFASLLAKLIVPSIFLAIVANLWPGDDGGR